MMTRPAFLQDDIRIKAHFLICFLALVIYRYPLKETWKMPSAAYTRDKLTDALHTVYGFETDYKFITKRQMKNIQKKVKAGNKILYFKTTQQIAEPQQNQEVQRFFCFVAVKDRILV